MEKQISLAELTKDVSDKVLESLSLVNTLEEIMDVSMQEGTLITIIRQNLESAFQKIETSRQMIYILD